MEIGFTKFLVICGLITALSAAEIKSNVPVNVNYFDCKTSQYMNHDTFSNKYHNLEVYCYRGCEKRLLHIWLTIKLEIDIKSDAFTLYNGELPEEVFEKYLNMKESWFFTFFEKKSKLLTLHPFNQSCFGITTKDPYKISLKTIKIDFWKIVLLAFGLTLFHYSTKLKDFEIFYYISGTSLGIFGFLLVLIYLTSRLIPKKPLMLGTLIGGWSVFVYLIDKMFQNLKYALQDYYSYLLWYTIVSGCISFLICYRYGPVTNKRSRNIIEWLMKSLSCCLIYYSTCLNDIAAMLITFLIIQSIMPFRKMGLACLNFIKSKLPKKPRLITVEEYQIEAVVETEKALHQLREYCKSPECNQWMLAKKLRNLDKFSSFVEGESHISDDELLEYNTSAISDIETNDSDDSD